MTSHHILRRPKEQLHGKLLSSHTIASFMTLQNADNALDIDSNTGMDAAALDFLVRSKAINYWSSNKWLSKHEGEFFLTEEGVRKAHDRVNGKAGGQSIDAVHLSEALSRINGEIVDCEMDEYTGYVPIELPSIPPKGSISPGKTISNSETVIRDQNVKSWVLNNANGVCEGCNQVAPFHTDENTPYLEAHHVKFFSEGGSDTVENVVALCPNCHRRCHHSSDREDFKEQLYNSVKRLVLE